MPGIFEYSIIIGLTLLFLFNWENILYYIIGTFHYFLEQMDIKLHITLVTLILGLIGIVLFWYWSNKKAIQRLSYVDFMPEDEYERKKKEWTNAALMDLVQNPKYKAMKERLEDLKEDAKKRGILSAEPSLSAINEVELSDSTD